MSSFTNGKKVSVYIDKRTNPSPGRAKFRYYLRYIDPVSKRRVSLSAGTDMTMARSKRADLEQQLNTARAQETAGTGMTIAEFWERFLKAREADLAVSTVKAYDTCLKALRKVYPKKRMLDEISVYDAECFSTARLGTVKAVTANKEVNHLRTLFRYARKWGMVRINPFEEIRKRKEEPLIIRVVSPREERVLIRAVERSVFKSQKQRLKHAAMIRIAVQGGLRSAEVQHLMWRHIDFETGEVNVVCRGTWKSKSRKNRTVYIQEDTLKIIGQLRLMCGGPADDCPFMYHSSSTFSGIFRRIVKAAGIDKCTFHDLRRTCATRLAESGANPQVTMESMGHSSMEVTMRYYVRLSKQCLREAARKAARHSAGLPTVADAVQTSTQVLSG